ncbi:hypothetical protein BDN72DRAFT_617703 [Pluteus cervinus]|uniref:Uncharacterized protein n=1 Tax=Pluteus cervinus TaxID=181527 RepID=A0ACD3AVI2_9AGAR|nr:hypothetical protein BDN72DRAFT_617703 [Pluteus cervinus]
MATELPPEVWGRIFEYTCMDDGTMGRSLSLVSIFFHHASAPKFQSIAVKPGHLRHILKFLEVLQKATPIQRRVRYLFLGSNGTVTSNGSSTEGDYDPKDGYPSPDTDQYLDFPDSCHDDSDEGDEEDPDLESDSNIEWAPITEEELQDIVEDVDYFKSPEGVDASSLVQTTENTVDDMTQLDILTLDTIHAILELCSESILSLSVSVKNFVEPHGGHAFIFPRIRLLLLQDLTWIIPISYTLQEGFRRRHPRIKEPDPPSHDQPVLFPSLQRFHVAFPIEGAHRLWLERCCPRLRYLRTDWQADLFDRAVRKALNGPAGDTGTASVAHISMHTPSSVETHFIDVSLEDEWYGHMSAYKAICEDLGVGESCHIESRIVLAAKRRDDWKMTVKDWEERKLGNLGNPGFRWKRCPSYGRWLEEVNCGSLKNYVEE